VLPCHGELTRLRVPGPNGLDDVAVVGLDSRPRAHGGGSAFPLTAHAACRAAPSATYCPGGGTSTGRPSTVGAIRRTAPDRAPPPMRNTRATWAPAATRASMPSAIPHSNPSTAARARYAAVAVARRSPCTAPVASGRSGVRWDAPRCLRVRAAPMTDQLAGFRVPDDDFARLR
jgi:hypothetical protein